MRGLVLSLILFQLSLPASGQENARVWQAGLFAGVQRSDANAWQAEPLYAVIDDHGRTICTAFKVASSGSKQLFGSHRHCFSRKAKEACDQFRIRIRSDATGATGLCTEVILEVPENDFFIFAAEFSADEQKEISRLRGLELSRCSPKINSPLEMGGHPSDMRRHTRLTITHQCQRVSDSARIWDNEDPRSFRNKFEKEALGRFVREYYAYFKKNPEEKRAREIIEKHVGRTRFKHNCSTWSGNSGGPIWSAEHPEVAVGLPFSYFPSEFELRGGALPAENLADFVRRFEPILEQNRIAISSKLCDYADI